MINNWSLLIIILLGYLLLLATTIVFPKLVHRNLSALQSIRFVPTKAFFINSNRLLRFSGKFAILLCAFHWFLFFNANFLFGNIKTDSMIIRTDEIIDSSSRIMSSKRIMTVILDELETLTKASDNSFLGKLNKKSIFWIGYNPQEETQQILRDSTNHFFFEREVGLKFLIQALASLVRHLNVVAFMGPTIYYEAIDVIAIRRSLDWQKKQFIHHR